MEVKGTSSGESKDVIRKIMCKNKGVWVEGASMWREQLRGRYKHGRELGMKKREEVGVTLGLEKLHGLGLAMLHPIESVNEHQRVVGDRTYGICMQDG